MAKQGQRIPRSVRDFIEETRRNSPTLSYRQIVNMVVGRFGEGARIDQSSVGNILREAGLGGLHRPLEPQLIPGLEDDATRKRPADAHLKVLSASVSIDTYPLRRWLALRGSMPQNPLLEVEIEFALLRGDGGVINEVRVELDEGVRRDLRVLANIPRYFWLDTTFERDQAIPLQPGISRPFRSTREMPLVGSATEEVVGRLDELSVMIEAGRFTIHWETGLRGKQSFTPPSVEPSTLSDQSFNEPCS